MDPILAFKVTLVLFQYKEPKACSDVDPDHGKRA